MATTRKHVQDSIMKLDRDIVKLLIERTGKVQELAAFDADPMQSLKFLDNAVKTSRSLKGDDELINGVFGDLGIKFSFVEMQARVRLSVKSFKENDSDALKDNRAKGKAK